MKRQGTGRLWTGAGLASLLFFSPGALRAQDSTMIDLTAGAPLKAEPAEIFDLTQGAPPGSAASGAMIDLTASAPPGRSDAGDVFDLTRSGPPGQIEGEDVFDLTRSGPPGQDPDDVFDLTASNASFPDAARSGALPSVPSASSTAQNVPSTSVALALPEHSTIVRVIDGDTYEIEGGLRVRLSSVNTPEKRERIGPAVADAVRSLLLHKEITLAYGPTTRDSYGRLIGDVRVNGQSVAELLLREGLAHLFIIPPGRPANYAELVAAQEQARVAKKGIWSEERYRGPLHITSFHANARGDDRTNLAGEYLRIANTSGQDLNLAGFSLSNEHGMKLIFPDIVIPKGYTFQVFSGKGEMQGSLETPYRIFWNSEGPVWDNDEDRATLRDPDGRLIDEVFNAPRHTNKRTSYMSRAGT